MLFNHKPASPRQGESRTAFNHQPRESESGSTQSLFFSEPEFRDDDNPKKN
jgi:hypothetical protein